MKILPVLVIATTFYVMSSYFMYKLCLRKSMSLEPKAREMLDQLIDSAIRYLPKNLKITRDAKDRLKYEHDAEFIFGMVWGLSLGRLSRLYVAVFR